MKTKEEKEEKEEGEKADKADMDEEEWKVEGMAETVDRRFRKWMNKDDVGRKKKKKENYFLLPTFFSSKQWNVRISVFLSSGYYRCVLSLMAKNDQSSIISTIF